MDKELMKIKRIELGAGGYRDAMFGISVTLSGASSGVGDFRGDWRDHSERCQWTPGDQTRNWGETMRWIADLMKDAKKTRLQDMVGVPVEVTLDGNMLKSWRILTEVI